MKNIRSKRCFIIRWNWRGYLARYGIYQYLNYIRKLYFQEQRSAEHYKSLASGGYLKWRHVRRLIKQRLKADCVLTTSEKILVLKEMGVDVSLAQRDEVND